MSELVKWNEVKKAIAEAYEIDEIKLIRDQAEAYRYALKQAGEAPQVIRQAEEIKIRAERRAGEILKEMPKQKPGEYKRYQGSTVYPSLRDQGITKNQSSHWQRIADIPENEFEQYIVTAQEITTAGILKFAKTIERAHVIEKQKQKIEKKPFTGLYDVIVIDPPWPYGTRYDPTNRRVANPYPEMQIQELRELEIPANNDCVLFLWATHKYIWQAKELLDFWKFEYRNILVWDKMRMGMGELYRMQCEFCLVGIKGNPVLNNNHKERDIISEPRREHSRKPETFYAMIDRLCIGEKLDIFGREKRKGWDIYGNDTNKF